MYEFKMSAKEPALFITVIFLFLFVGLYLYMWFVPSSVPTYYKVEDNKDYQYLGSSGSTPSCSNQSESPSPLENHDHTKYHHNIGDSLFDTNYTRDSFTIVMPTFQRSTQLVQVLNHYCTVPHVAMILVIWNNVGQELPDKFKTFKCQVPVKFLIMKENKLTNRFKLYPEIQTEGIYLIY